jgi:hypothetical protein
MHSRHKCNRITLILAAVKAGVICLLLVGCQTAPITPAPTPVESRPPRLLAAPGGNSVSLIWDAYTNAALAQFKAYWSQTSGVYTNFASPGKLTSITIKNLAPGTNYFVVTAVLTDGQESLPSNEVAYSIVESPTGLMVVTLQVQASASATGPFLDLPGKVLQVTNAADVLQQYFRLRITSTNSP